MQRTRTALILAACALAACSSPTAAEIKPADLEFFEAKIRPVLVEHCYQCHSDRTEKPKAGLRLDTRDELLSGGKSGPVVVPGRPDESLLIRAIQHETLEMPPRGKLPQAVIENFIRWVERGAPDPRDGTDAAKNDQDASRDHWSFQPLGNPEIPAVADERWPHTAVDRFILARQESAGLRPIDDADRHTLVRRVYFDLIGLPPEPADVDAFLSDSSPDAWAALVDRLLESPQFGVRWGRHWLDVVRYAESTGHERNFTYPHAWRYRDYVVESFNEDKPYDQFIREQIAGDLLPAADWRQRDEQRIATGLLALGPKDLLSGPESQFRADVVDDQIDVTSKAFLGLTVSCARCHDHKFDPVTTEEYYALAGVFHSTEWLYGTQPGTGGGNNRYPSELYPLGPDGPELQEVYLRHREQIDALVKPLQKAENDLKKARSRNQDDRIPELKQRVEELRAKQRELQEHAPPRPEYAIGVREADKPADTRVLISGNIRNADETVPRGFPAAIGVREAPPIKPDSSGRLELAEWLTRRDNPLTARVMANRVWHHLFGQGIVSTVDNFGVTGSRPTHPELLDYLAIRFMEEGWSVKQLIRTLVLSRTYQLSSRHDDRNDGLDPDNLMLWRMRARRLEGEAIRDAMLAVSGRLDPAPPANGTVVAEMGDGCLVRQLKTDPLKEESPHRSIYLPNCRYFLPEVLELFDGASPSLVVGARETTTVPAQTLYLLNDEFVVEQSHHAARRLLSMSGSDRERVDFAYRLAFARRPADAERSRAHEAIREIEQSLIQEGEGPQAAQEAAWAAFSQSLFASAEFRYIY